MNCHLIFVHGRSQQHKDASALKKTWVEAWQRGLEKSRLQLPIAETSIRFPYYGQALFNLVSDPSSEPAEVLLRGGDGGEEASVEERQFIHALLAETLKKAAVSDAQILETLDFAERGNVLNTPYVRAMLRALDKNVALASSLSLSLATRDVYRYLSNPGIRDRIESGVREAFVPGVPCVVVGHSLGTIVTYNLLRREAAALGLVVPLHVTLGSPLAVSAIKQKLRPLDALSCVGRWFNAMDSRDIVALHPLDDCHFKIVPAIENKVDVDNQTENRHGITGYLEDAVVARQIYDALVGYRPQPIAQ